jgi:NAD(P)-dependent dehydrogenase (short-subunit alcohol dehydrogenase family)
MRFAGKVALITGAASGIGAAAARRLADEGAAIIAFDRDPAGREVMGSLHVRGGAVHKFVQGDVTSEGDVVQVFEGLRQEKRAAHVVVTCAGIAPRSLAHEMDTALWRRVIDVNLTGTFLVGREALRLMRDTDGGVIVTVASELALVGHPRLAAYTAAKAGVIGLTRTLALEGAAFGIRVNAICPGATDTPLYWRSHRRDAETFREIEMVQPLGRLCLPDEIAAGIAFLASGDAGCATGSVLVMDGGYTVR